MIFRSYKTEETKKNPHKIDVKQLYDKDSAQVMHIFLQPGEALMPHKTPVDVIFYVLDGTPTIHIGTESQTFEKDILVESPANVVHYISNNGCTAARILVTKAPKPTSQTKLL